MNNKLENICKKSTHPEFITEINSVEYSVATYLERDPIFALRYDVLVSTEGSFAKNVIRRIFDKYDFLPETTLIQARLDGKLVGSVRLVRSNPTGLPSDNYFDVRRVLKGVDPKQIADLNRIVVDKEYRKYQIGVNLMRVGHSLGISSGVTHFVGVANPKAYSLFVDKLGWYPVEEEKFDPVYSVPYIPIVGESALVSKLEEKMEPYKYLTAVSNIGAGKAIAPIA